MLTVEDFSLEYLVRCTYGKSFWSLFSHSMLMVLYVFSLKISVLLKIENKLSNCNKTLNITLCVFLFNIKLHHFHTGINNSLVFLQDITYLSSFNIRYL